MAIVLVIVMLGSFVFAIFDAIIEFIKAVILNIINDALDFLAHPIKNTIRALGEWRNDFSARYNGNFSGTALEITQPKQLIEISQREFEAMRDAIDESISRDTAGLDDVMLKKMLLTFNTGKYSKNADVILELTPEEADAFENDEIMPSSFSIKQGKDIDQLKVTKLETAANTVKTFFKALFGEESIFDSEIYKNAKSEFEAKQDKYYLHTKGVLKFVNENDVELVYYDEEVLKKLYTDEFQANRYGAKKDYAASVWEYLSTKCYTDGSNNTEMKIYCHETVEEELVEWNFSPKDADNASFAEVITDFHDKTLSNISINRQKIDEEYLYDATEWINDTKDLGFLGTLIDDRNGYILGMDGIVDIAKKTYSTMNIDYYSLVSQYTTPVEFMVDLLNISSSKEFVNAFIDKVTAETEVVLKLYRVSDSSSTEITEVSEEETTVKAEAVVTAEIVGVNVDGDGLGYISVDAEGYTGYKNVMNAYVKLSDGEIFFGLADSLAINVGVYDIPEELEGIQVRINFKASGETRDICVPDDVQFGSGFGNLFADNLDTSCDFTIQSWFNTRYKTRKSNATIKRYTTNLITETKLDIAVQEANTWYGFFEYNNYIQKKQTFESENKYGNRVTSGAEPIMIDYTKAKATYNRNNTNKNTIFKVKKISDYAWAEIGSRVEKWYSELTADEILFWVTPGGHLTHSLVTLYGNRGLQLYENEEELLNIQLTYAMENGPDDWWLNRYYIPVQMECKYKDYEKGTLYEQVNRELVEGTPTVRENTDFFLSLLKNGTGRYNKDLSYNPNGIEVVYKTVYDSEDKVGKFFETSAQMLFNLMESSPYTSGLVDVMKYTLYQYTTQDYGVTEFEFVTFDREDFENI